MTEKNHIFILSIHHIHVTYIKARRGSNLLHQLFCHIQELWIFTILWQTMPSILEIWVRRTYILYSVTFIELEPFCGLKRLRIWKTQSSSSHPFSLHSSRYLLTLKGKLIISLLPVFCWHCCCVSTTGVKYIIVWTCVLPIMFLPYNNDRYYRWWVARSGVY